MSFSQILQRRMKPLKYTGDDDVYTKLHEGLLTSDGGDDEDEEIHSKYKIPFQSNGEKDVTLGNDVRSQLVLLRSRS